MTEPPRAFESHGLIDQSNLDGDVPAGDRNIAWKPCNPEDLSQHRMISIKTGGQQVQFVEQCGDCGWIDGFSLDWWAQNAVKRSLSDRAKAIAVATETQPFAFVQVEGHPPLELEEILGQALGAASVCWENATLNDMGTFDSSRATAVYGRLLAEVQRFQRLAVEDALASHACGESGSASASSSPASS